MQWAFHLARALLALEPEATLLSFDDYYRDLSHMTPEQRAEVNYDHPDALDTKLFSSPTWTTWPLVARQRACLRHGDSHSHWRHSPSDPAPLVIVEGISAWY